MTENTTTSDQGSAQPIHGVGNNCAAHGIGPSPELSPNHFDQQCAQSSSNNAWEDLAFECCGSVPAQDRADQKFSITMAGHSKGSRYSSRSYDFDELFDMLTTHSEQPQKDSACFVAGKLIDGIRKLPNVEQISLLVYDIDGGSSIAELDAHLADKPLSIMYTTYSHQTTKTTVKTTAFSKWATDVAKVPNLPTLERLKAYFEHVKKFEVLKKNPQFDVEAELATNNEGSFYVVTHDPIDKVRIVFPLDKPIFIQKLAASSKGCYNEYKRIYHGVGNALGLDFDPACSDPTRLHFLP